uniref:Putative secreted protein n=1 Tax=Anopheles marajoara TaxID=58244 RepID=A0A2M4CAM3_9DIPT
MFGGYGGCVWGWVRLSRADLLLLLCCLPSLTAPTSSGGIEVPNLHLAPAAPHSCGATFDFHSRYSRWPSAGTKQLISKSRKNHNTN